MESRGCGPVFCQGLGFLFFYFLLLFGLLTILTIIFPFKITVEFPKYGPTCLAVLGSKHEKGAEWLKLLPGLEVLLGQMLLNLSDQMFLGESNSEQC